jgi:hypothetical protein
MALNRHPVTIGTVEHQGHHDSLINVGGVILQQKISDSQFYNTFMACIRSCPELDPNAPEAQQQAAGRCIRACQETRDAAVTAATACSDGCDEAFAECVTDLTTCDDPTSTAFLMQVQIANWPAHLSNDLADPDHGIFICEDHFPPGTPEGDQVQEAVEAYSSVTGSAIGLFPLWQEHQDKSALFADPPGFSSFDYVDNANDPFVHACHPDNTTACSDSPDGTINGFAINTCSYGNGDWKGGGNTEFFAITANANCYGYFSDPTSTDYVGVTGALHELGHAVGMKHTAGWPVADNGYISTMQGNLRYLSAYDNAFLRQFYPEATLLATHNFVASSKIRMDFGGPNEVKGTFEDENPRSIYLVGNQVYDCDTQQPATFYTAWFNTGTADQLPEHCMVNELRIEDPSSFYDALLWRWHAADMPSESQDQWTGPAVADATDFADLPLGVPLDLVFEVNVYEQWRERGDDNQMRAPITIYGTSACTSPSPLPPRPQPAIRALGSNTYEVATGLINTLMAEPERLLRGAAIAPARVGGSGLGFRLFNLDDGSLFAALGARQGDILWRVEGHPVSGASIVLNGLQRLLTTGTLHVTIVRDKTMQQVTYRLR